MRPSAGNSPLSPSRELHIRFGLRLDEGLQFEPSVAMRGPRFWCTAVRSRGPCGTISMPIRRLLLGSGSFDQGAEIARTHGMGMVAVPGSTLSQARKHY